MKLNIVDFSEGILGLDHVLPDGRQARDVVAKCLRTLSFDGLANDLESGKRTNIEVIRSIGEQRLHEITQLFYAQEKE